METFAVQEKLALEAVPKNGTVVIQKPAPNQRTITSGVIVCTELKTVWDTLTDYEHLPNFIPNLAVSRRCSHPQGGIRLEQVGVQCVLGFHFRASVILDMFENTSEDKSEIRFVLVDSKDFQIFEGSWLMYPVNNRKWTHLIYQVTVEPKRFVPVNAVEWRIKEDIPNNLFAVKRQAESHSRK
eukprot:jgi/Galph1/1192/GphlegSOOS_G5928.1